MSVPQNKKENYENFARKKRMKRNEQKKKQTKKSEKNKPSLKLTIPSRRRKKKK